MIATFILFLLIPALLFAASCHRLGRSLLMVGLLFLLSEGAAWATAPITSVTGNLVATSTWSASQTQSGGSTAQPAIQSNGNTIARASFTSTGSGANSINQVAVKVYSIGASSSTTIDLSAAIRNVVNASDATFARIKSITITLLTSTTTSGNYDATQGTACTSITIGNAASNAWISVSNRGGFGGTTFTFDIPNGGSMSWSVDNANGFAITSGSNCNLKILNNDASVAAAVQLTLLGADA